LRDLAKALSLTLSKPRTQQKFGGYELLDHGDVVLANASWEDVARYLSNAAGDSGADIDVEVDTNKKPRVAPPSKKAMYRAAKPFQRKGNQCADQSRRQRTHPADPRQ
jgi:hypothetical protein